MISAGLALLAYSSIQLASAGPLGYWRNGRNGGCNWRLDAGGKERSTNTFSWSSWICHIWSRCIDCGGRNGAVIFIGH